MTTPTRIDGATLARLRKTLRRHAREGFARAVFAEPGEAAEPTVHEGRGHGTTPSEAELHALVQAAERAAKEGRVKHTLVIDDSTRVKIDARHGRAKVQALDEARASKAMGGKDRPLRPDSSAPLLRAIGLQNADGTMSAKHAKKYKQVNHFVEVCRPIFERLPSERPMAVLDLGCGNAYLTFVMAEALRLQGREARLHGVDARADLVERASERAKVLGWPHVTFQRGEIADVDPLATPLHAVPDVVIALHACDTATDDALALAIEHGVREILCAPCCQRELATQLQASHVPLPAIARHGLLLRDYASAITDALRAEILDACGYAVEAVEFVASEHTPKNVLLRAHRRHADATLDPSRWKLDRVAARMDELGVKPRLLQRLHAISRAPAADPR
jgi:SAM-dependent methyltransferase